MVVNSLPARVFVAVMVIMDIILTIMDLAKADKTGPDQAAFDWISFITGLIFVVDVAGRLYAYGFERYFSDPWEAADFGIVCVTFSVSVAMLALGPYEFHFACTLPITQSIKSFEVQSTFFRCRFKTK